MLLSARAKHIAFAFLLHAVIIFFGIVSQLGLSSNHLTLTHSWADHFIQWDSQWFINISKYGYLFPLSVQQQFATTGNIVPFTPSYRPAAFLPGLPILIHIFSPVGTVILINVLFCLSLWLMYRLIERERPGLALIGTLLFAINPCAIYFSALYTETLTVLAVLLIMTGLSKARTWPGFILSLAGAFLATSVHDLGAFAILFALRYIRLRLWRRAIAYMIAALLPPILYELYLVAHFHTLFALLSAESSWHRSWRLPFTNIVDSLTKQPLTLNTVFAAILCALVIIQIVYIFQQDITWRPMAPEASVFSMETGLWMTGILLLGLCAYIPITPDKSILRFFCVLWPVYIPTFLVGRSENTQTYGFVSLASAFGACAVFGTALFSHGWFFQ